MGVNLPQAEPSDDPAGLVNTLTAGSLVRISEPGDPLGPSRFLTHRNYEIIKAYYFKLLNFGVIYYTGIDN